MPDTESVIELEFLSGPRDGDVVRWHGAEFTVGTGDEVDVILPGDTTVTGQMARIVLQGEAVSVEDLGKGATTVNGRPLAGPRTVEPDDVVRIGKTEFACRRPGPADAASGPISSSRAASL